MQSLICGYVPYTQAALGKCVKCIPPQHPARINIIATAAQISGLRNPCLHLCPIDNSTPFRKALLPPPLLLLLPIPPPLPVTVQWESRKFVLEIFPLTWPNHSQDAQKKRNEQKLNDKITSLLLACSSKKGMLNLGPLSDFDRKATHQNQFIFLFCLGQSMASQSTV